MNRPRERPTTGTPRRRRTPQVLAVLLTMSLSLSTMAQKTPWEDAGGNVHDGTEVMIDYPEGSLRKKNTETAGKGNCVFTSIWMAAIWQGIVELYPIISWLTEGGGYPAKVDELLSRNAPGVEYMQYEGEHPEKVIEKALKSRRMVCMTYGYGQYYRSKGVDTIYHMVDTVHLDGTKGAIIDNNDPEHITWMSRDELLKRSKHPSGVAWLIVFFAPPPPPVPIN